MASSIRETAYLKPPKKRPFEDHEHKKSQVVPPNFRRPRFAGVRDWPPLCGPLAKLTENSTGFMAGNLLAPIGNAIQSGKLQSTADAKVTKDKFPGSYPPQRVSKDITVVRDLPAKEIGVDPRVRRNLLQLDSWCQSTVGNTVGKSVQRTARKEGEICSKGRASIDHQKFVDNRKVQEALTLFHESLEKLTDEAKQTQKKGILRKLPAEVAMDLKRQQKWVNTAKRIGHVPGIKIGDTFRYRVELSIIGLHSHFQNGIDYMMKDGKILAVSVVDSGRYANNKESSDVLIYSGQGGNPKVGKKQAEDQKLERGNLALKNSMDVGTPVRVTRGFQATKINSPGYTYEGLYFVDGCEQQRNENEKLIFKFQLRRIEGQPKCDTNESKYSILCRETRLNSISHGRELKRWKKSKLQRRTILNDISWGKEERPIPVVNTIDDEEPQPFTYIARMVYPESYDCSISNGCDCTNGCSDSVKCACALKNGGEIPFNCNGAVVEAKPWIYECGPLCKCPPSCANRVSQNGIRFQLEVFKTKSTGWGVRSRNYIPSGSFICEYVGELIQHKEAEKSAGSAECLFDLGGGVNYLPSRPSSSKAMDDLLSCSSKAMDDLPSCSSEANHGAFAIDASKFANVGRFINHSCSPNLYAQNVLYDNEDKRMAHIMLFATKNIPPMRELTYDYSYMVGQVRDVAGSRECTGKMD